MVRRRTAAAGLIGLARIAGDEMVDLFWLGRLWCLVGIVMESGSGGAGAEGRGLGVALRLLLLGGGGGVVGGLDGRGGVDGLDELVLVRGRFLLLVLVLWLLLVLLLLVLLVLGIGRHVLLRIDIRAVDPVVILARLCLLRLIKSRRRANHPVLLA